MTHPNISTNPSLSPHFFSVLLSRMKTEVEHTKPYSNTGSPVHTNLNNTASGQRVSFPPRWGVSKWELGSAHPITYRGLWPALFLTPLPQIPPCAGSYHFRYQIGSDRLLRQRCLHSPISSPTQSRQPDYISARLGEAQGRRCPTGDRPLNTSSVLPLHICQYISHLPPRPQAATKPICGSPSLSCCLGEIQTAATFFGLLSQISAGFSVCFIHRACNKWNWSH